MTPELRERLLAIIDAARGNADEKDDRDCYFYDRGRDEACDQIIKAIKELD